MLHGAKQGTGHPLGLGRFCHGKDVVVDGAGALGGTLAGVLEGEQGLTAQIRLPGDGHEVVFNPVGGIHGGNVDGQRPGQHQPATIVAQVADLGHVVAIADRNGQIPLPSHFVALVLLQTVGSLGAEVNAGDIVEAQGQTRPALAPQLVFVGMGNIPVGVGPLGVAGHEHNAAFAVATGQIG